MKNSSDKYTKFKADDGERYYCPSALSEARLADDQLDSECVEASTAGRYSGNIVVEDRFNDQEASQ